METNNETVTLNTVTQISEPKPREIRRRRVSSLGTITLSRGMSGQVVSVEDYGNGTFIVKTTKGTNG